jgi:hypothetical protein
MLHLKLYKMKRTMLMALIISATTVACGQKISADKVPALVKAAFAKQHPGTSVKWEMENGKYEAGFKDKGTTTSVLYTADGTMTESETDIKIADLPKAVMDYVKAHYKGKIKEGAKITTAAGVVTYEAEVDGKDVIFDSTGKFIKEVKE